MIYASNDPAIAKARDWPHGLGSVRAHLNAHVHPLQAQPSIYFYTPAHMHQWFLETRTPTIIGGWQKDHRGIGFLHPKRLIRFCIPFEAGRWDWTRFEQSRDADAQVGKLGEEVVETLITEGFFEQYPALGLRGPCTTYSVDDQRFHECADRHVIATGKELEIKTELILSWNLFVQLGERYYTGTPYVHDYHASQFQGLR